MAAGVKILKEEPYYSWWSRKEKPLCGCGHDQESIGVGVEGHQAEPCHGAAIERDGKVVYVCRDPARHGAADPRVAREQERQRQEREKARLGREAARARREAIATVLSTANTSHLPFAAAQVLACWRVDESKLACQLLDLPPEPGRYSPSYTEALSEYAGRGMAAAIKALLALALASGEAIVTGSWGGASERTRRHLELLVAAGYQPHKIDRKHLTGEEQGGGARGARLPRLRLHRGEGVQGRLRVGRGSRQPRRPLHALPAGRARRLGRRRPRRRGVAVSPCTSSE